MRDGRISGQPAIRIASARVAKQSGHSKSVTVIRPYLPESGAVLAFHPNTWRHADRRKFIWEAFAPLLDSLEGKNRAPADETIADVLRTFDSEGVHAIWEKSLERRHVDPEGAITSARTLLETVCKRILDDAQQSYNDSEDLPQLYDKTAGLMSLAPSHYSEQVFKAILGNCKSIVGNLASLRNKIGDAHGRGGRPVKPLARHAALAVNLAGAMATFLVETWIAKKTDTSN